MAYDRISGDGRHGLKGHTVFRIVNSGAGDLVDFEVGQVMDVENFETACDAADEEARVMIAEARAEFGFDPTEQVWHKSNC